MSATPGPWDAVERNGRWVVQSQHVRHVNADGHTWYDVAYLCTSNGCGEDDARLLAAAHVLLAELELVSHLNSFREFNDRLPFIRAAIALASPQPTQEQP